MLVRCRAIVGSFSPARPWPHAFCLSALPRALVSPLHRDVAVRRSQTDLTATHWEPRFSRPFPRKSASGWGGGLGLLGFFCPLAVVSPVPSVSVPCAFSSSPLLLFSSLSRVSRSSSLCAVHAPTWLVHARPPAVKAKFAVIGTTSGGVTLDRSGHGLRLGFP